MSRQDAKRAWGQSAGRRDPRREVPVEEPERRRPLVLVVEDEAHDWEIYGKMLWYNGFEVLHAPDGKTGLLLAERRLPDLVLLDLGLPDLSGLELCTMLKRRRRTRDIPVMVLSARSESEAGEAARSAGCIRYLEKPVGPVDVLHMVEEVVGRPPPAGEDVEEAVG
jgi:DNA-binding response OmpR family regulator